MEILISKFGETSYAFTASDSDNARTASPSLARAVLRFSDQTKWGITALNDISLGDKIIENVGCAVLPVGAGKQRICVKCYTVTKSVKVREDCPSFSFCSNGCLKEWKGLLDDCGMLISCIRGWNSDSSSRDKVNRHNTNEMDNRHSASSSYSSNNSSGSSSKFCCSGGFDLSQYSDLAILAVLLLYNCSSIRDPTGSHKGTFHRNLLLNDSDFETLITIGGRGGGTIQPNYS